MSNKTMLYLKSGTPDEMYKNVTILHFIRKILEGIDFGGDFEDLVYPLNVIRDDYLLPLKKEIIQMIKTQIYEESNEEEENRINKLIQRAESLKLSYDEEQIFKSDRQLCLAAQNKIISFISLPIAGSTMVEESAYIKKFAEIQRIFKLSEAEIECFKFLYFIDIDRSFSLFVDGCTDSKPLITEKIIQKKIFSLIAQIKPYEVTSLFMDNASLRKYGLLTSEYDIEDGLFSYIEGFSTSPLTSKYYNTINHATLPIESFTFRDDDMAILNKILSADNNTGFKILFYGKPGTGKSEFSKALAMQHKYNINELFRVDKKNSDRWSEKDNEDFKFRIRGLYAYQNMVSSAKTVLIIDEADGFLSSTNSGLFSSLDETKKGAINSLLDELDYNQIWIINNIRTVDESTLRRFDYAMEFPDMSNSQRMNIWHKILEKYNFPNVLSDEEVTRLTDRFQVNAGIIDKAIQNCRRLYPDNVIKEDFIKTIEITILSHLKMINGPGFTIKDVTKPDNELYTLKGLNIRGDIESHINLLERFSAKWDNNDHKVKNMNVLMWGPPGTGKTEFAKYIARRLKRKLIIKTASDILDKYVGGTEENIASAFREAEREKAILFIDEVDGLLSSRANAQRSWEVTQVNELLVRMENFHGIFICATNFYENIDPAAARRYNIKIEFDYLVKDNIEYLYNEFFGKISGDLSDRNAVILAESGSLTPGDFKVVYQKFAMYDENEISEDDIVKSLQEEIRVKKPKDKRIGFR